MTFQFSSVLQWWFPNWIFYICLSVSMHVYRVYMCTPLLNFRWNKKRFVSRELVRGAHALYCFQNNHVHLLNRLCKIFFLPVYFIYLENMVQSGKRCKDDYHISSVKYMIWNLAFLWVSEVLNGWTSRGSVLYQSWPIYVYWESRWKTGCCSNLLTYELVQMQLESDMTQIQSKCLWITDIFCL